MIELTSKQKSKMNRAIKSLNDLRAEVEKENPEHEIVWYFESEGSACLMDGPSHHEDGSPAFENIIHRSHLRVFDAGGW